MHTRHKGNLTELEVATALTSAGYTVLFPFGDHAKYDLVYDDGESLIKVQCKTGRLISNGDKIEFSTSTRDYSDSDKTKTHYRGKADVFCVYCVELDQVYMVPVMEVGKSGAYLRLTEPRNGQVKDIRWAKDYLIESILD